MFSPVVVQFWDRLFAAGRTVAGDGVFCLVVDAQPYAQRQAAVLTTPDGHARMGLTPEVAELIGLADPTDGETLTEAQARARLIRAGITLNGPDYLHYFSGEAKAALLAEPPHPLVRRLTSEDADLFAAFTAACSAPDLDEAYVELDHWQVFGVISGGVLAAAASAYPWEGSQIADVGVITHPEHRQNGHARAVVRHISRCLLELDHEPQYRCYHTNMISAAVASSAGMDRFGSWDVVAPPEH